MKTIVLGYTDERGLSKSVIVMDANVPQADQIKLMSEAKATGVLPDGLVRLEFVTLECHNIALRRGNTPAAKPETKPEPVTKRKTIP